MLFDDESNESGEEEDDGMMDLEDTGLLEVKRMQTRMMWM